MIWFALQRLRQEEGEEKEVIAPSDLFDLKDIDSDDWYYDTGLSVFPFRKQQYQINDVIDNVIIL